MKINPSERDILLGPTVVAVFGGAASAFCVVAFDSDYGGTLQLWQKILSATLGFFGCFLVAFGLFGLLPILFARLMRRTESASFQTSDLGRFLRLAATAKPLRESSRPLR
jgi:hypothetical protein